MSPAQTRSAKKRSSASGQEAPAKARKVENGAPSTKDTPPKPEILETGILDYFIRARVGIEDPKNVDDIARGYLVLRPLRQDTDLTKRPLPDSLTSRLLAMPKKHLPQSSSDRFMAFVDEPGLSYSELASDFLASREYETKTMGERHVPSATPVGEGVYAITASGSESHLVYISTLPESKGEFQQSLGLQERGSFIICTKNPKFKSPAYARLPEAPEYPKSILDELGSYRWVPVKPEHLNYKNAQILLIGHNDGKRLVKGDQERSVPVEEKLESLEEDDFKGMRHLSSDESEAIYADLHTKAKKYHDLPDHF